MNDPGAQSISELTSLLDNIGIRLNGLKERAGAAKPDGDPVESLLRAPVDKLLVEYQGLLSRAKTTADRPTAEGAPDPGELRALEDAATKLDGATGTLADCIRAVLDNRRPLPTVLAWAVYGAGVSLLVASSGTWPWSHSNAMRAVFSAPLGAAERNHRGRISDDIRYGRAGSVCRQRSVLSRRTKCSQLSMAMLCGSIGDFLGQRIPGWRDRITKLCAQIGGIALLGGVGYRNRRYL